MSKDECCYLCNECPSSFASLDKLEAHLRGGAHFSATTTTEECSLSSKDTVAVESIPDIKMEDCTSINSASPASSSSSNLMDSPFKLSQQSDTSENGYSCNMCARRFPDRDQLNTHHVHTHRQKPNYVCEICNLSFGIKRDKQTHMRVHSGELPQKCDECGKEFGTRQLLKKHQMWHTGKRNHQCHQCGKSFFQKGHLSQHRAIHRNERPFACTLCEKTFIFKFDLNRHMKIHNERGFCCIKCGKSFARQSALDEHNCKKPAIKKLSTKLASSPLSDFSQTDTVTMNSPSTVGQQSPNSLNLMNPLSPGDAKKENRPITNEPISQVGFARMAQILLAQHQQRMLNAAAQNFVAQQQQQVIQPAVGNSMNLTPIQLSLLLQQYRQQTTQATYHCSICAMNFDNQATYTLHCSRAHFNSTQLSNNMIPSPATAEQLMASSQPEFQSAAISNELIAQTLNRQKEEQFETATTSSCASSPQKVSPLLTQQQLISADWLSANAMSTCLRTHSESPPCEKCVEYQSKYTELEKNYNQTRSELDRLKELMGQLGTMTNFMNLNWPRAAN